MITSSITLQRHAAGVVVEVPCVCSIFLVFSHFSVEGKYQSLACFFGIHSFQKRSLSSQFLSLY